MDRNRKSNPLQEFTNQLFQYITGNNTSNKSCNLIKQNTDRLQTNGDFSFSNKRHVWTSFLARQETAGFCADINCKHSEGVLFIDDDVIDEDDADADSTFPFHSHYTVTKLLAVSSSFALPVARVTIIGDWCNVYLDRRKCFEIVLYKVLLDNENVNCVGQGCRKPIRVTTSDDDHTSSVTEYRLKLLTNVIKNLINESDYWELCEETSEIHVHLMTKSSTVVGNDTRKIMSGVVTDPQTGNKLATMTSDEYIK